MIVLDSSALVDVLTDQQHAGWLLDHMQSGEVMAPAHQPAEVLSAIARLQREGVLPADEASGALAAAMALPQQLVVPTAWQVQRAFDLRGRVRVVDGLYVALAEEGGVPLLTTDQRLVRADPPCEVLAP